MDREVGHPVSRQGRSIPRTELRLDMIGHCGRYARVYFDIAIRALSYPQHHLITLNEGMKLATVTHELSDILCALIRVLVTSTSAIRHFAFNHTLSDSITSVKDTSHPQSSSLDRLTMPSLRSLLTTA